MSKLTLEEIDSHYESNGDCDDYHWDYAGPEPKHNIDRVRKLISNRIDVDESLIDITWCAPVVEYCLYINGKWSGYVDFDEEYSNCPLSQDIIDNRDEYFSNMK
ncbi:hypothetical protein ZPAH1_orf00213 [Aeromonas phage ZPAH1]|nr:hypothetical protein ASwh1_164 [Aeromonas phage Aswh_1]QQG33975.1 hypothetical protein ZPAH1_orf00213 [Aeromonas phage ZPAH1]